ncbi:MAG: hypothetical protein IJP48_09045 [Synergistaceae bacterium]|nr:hypothetical protein [Synergistaceae bacterium]
MIISAHDETEIIFLLDRSGSMYICEEDTIGGYNSFLDIQRRSSSRAFITTVMFDNHYEILHNHIDIHRVKNLTEQEYFARGSTALLDALGKVISEVSKRQSEYEHQLKNIKTLVVIMTDGLDNASRKYNIKEIYGMIHEQQDHHNWEFIFLGAGIDSVRTAQSIGISQDRAANFIKTSEGIRSKFDNVSQTVSHFRESGEINSDWKK